MSTEKDTPQSKPVNKNALWIIVFLVLVVTNIILLISLNSAKSDLTRYSDVADEISNLQIELADCRVRLDDSKANEVDKDRRVTSLESQLKRLREEAKEATKLTKQTIREYQNTGLRNPEQDIIRDLMKNSQLIPVNSNADGGMRFYDNKKIYVMSRNLVFAHFSDGTRNGVVILEYKVKSDGRISWVPIKAYEGNNF